MRGRPLGLFALALSATSCAWLEGLDHLEKVSDAGGGGGAGFCAARAPVPLFCDDFDVHPLPGPWNTLSQLGGTLVEDDATSVSPPRSLLEVIPPLAAGSLDTSLRSAPLDMPALPATLHFELSVRPVSVDETAGAALILASLDFLDAAQDRYSLILTLFPVAGALTVSLGEQSGFADGGSTYRSHPLPDPLPLGQWTRVVLDVTYTDAATATVQATLGKASEFAVPEPLHPTVPRVTQTLVGIGATYGTVPSNGWTVRYDDVVLEAVKGP